MAGTVRLQSTSIKAWVAALDELHDDGKTQLRGSAHILHLRDTGLRKLARSMSEKLVQSRDGTRIEGVKSRIRDGITRDFGPDIADKVLARFQAAPSISSGDLRAMLREAESAKLEQTIREGHDLGWARDLADQFAPDPETTTVHSGRQIAVTNTIIQAVSDEFGKGERLSDARRGEVLAQVRADIIAAGRSGQARLRNEDVQAIVRHRFLEALNPEAAHNETLQARARSFAFVSVADVTRYTNLAMKARKMQTEETENPLEDLARNFKLRQEAERASIERDDLAKKFGYSPALRLAQELFEVSSHYQQFSADLDALSASKGDKNRNVLIANLHSLADSEPADPAAKRFADANYGPADFAILGFQIGLKIPLLDKQVKEAIRKGAAAEANFAKADRGNNAQEAEALRAARVQLSGTAEEIRKVVSKAQEDFRAVASLLQNAAMLQGLGPEVAQTARSLGEHHAQLADEFADPQGPVQGLLALATLAEADPRAAQRILQEAGAPGSA